MMSNWQSNPISTHSNNKIINKTYDIVIIYVTLHSSHLQFTWKNSQEWLRFMWAVLQTLFTSTSERVCYGILFGGCFSVAYRNQSVPEIKINRAYIICLIQVLNLYKNVQIYKSCGIIYFNWLKINLDIFRFLISYSNFYDD